MMGRGNEKVPLHFEEWGDGKIRNFWLFLWFFHPFLVGEDEMCYLCGDFRKLRIEN